MKKLIVLLLVLFSLNGFALERMDLRNVSIKGITADTQAQPDANDDNHFSLVWWVPYEYWASVFERDPNITGSVKTEMLKVLKEYTVFGIVQADVSAFGSFNFYNRKEVFKTLEVSYGEYNKNKVTLSLEKNVSGDMQLLMEQIGPVLKAAMGNMGANFHFFIYSDLNKNGDRIIDPYKKGKIDLKLNNRKSEELEVEFKTPLNSLFVPRICPNGEKAHVSWSYCPWSGKKI